MGESSTTAEQQSGRSGPLFLCAVVLLCCFAAQSCSPRPVGDPLAYTASPGDFALAVTVYAPEGGAVVGEEEGPGWAVPRAWRPARYIVEPGGTFRAALGEGVSEATYPGRTRQLSASQVDGLWRLVRDSGLLEPGSPARVPAPGMVHPRPDRTTAMIYLAWAGKRQHYRVTLDAGTAEAAGVEQVIEALAELAWVPG